MQLSGRIQNGVVVIEGGPVLPEGTEVTVVCVGPGGPTASVTKQRIHLPLVSCQTPGSVNLTGPMIAEILNAEDLSPRR
jgi:hypothetical protein